MTYEQTSDGGNETIEVSQNTGPLVWAAAILPLLVITAGVVLLIAKSVPYLLMALMLVSAVLLCQLSLSAADNIWPKTLILDDVGLTIKRLQGSRIYPWHEVRSVKVIPSAGVFTDDPRSELEDRIAVGVFLKGGSNAGDTSVDADIVLCTGTRANATMLMRLAETIDSYARKRATRAADKATKAQNQGRAAEFRRRAPAGPAVPQGSHFAAPSRTSFGRRQDR